MVKKVLRRCTATPETSPTWWRPGNTTLENTVGYTANLEEAGLYDAGSWYWPGHSVEVDPLPLLRAKLERVSAVRDALSTMLGVRLGITGACRPGSKWCHTKSGGFYIVTGTAELKRADSYELEGLILVLYRDAEGPRRYARELAEFEARFTEVPS